MKYVAYYRVSTQKQGKSGLGLEAQRKMVNDFVAANGGEIVAEYTEVESGKHDDRPELVSAMNHAALVGGRLLVGKLDRLSRDLHFITSLQKSRVDFVVSDMPNCDSFTINIYGALAQRERELISARTKAGLAAARAKGVKLGKNNLTAESASAGRVIGRDVQKAKADKFATKVVPLISKLQAKGMSLRGVAEQLNADGIQTVRGGKWTAASVKNIINRIIDISITNILAGEENNGLN